MRAERALTDFAIQRQATLPEPSAVVGRILDSSRLAAIFAGVEPTGLLYFARFEAKVLAKPHANLNALLLFTTEEWDRLAAEYIHKTCHSFRRHQEVAMAKNGAFIG
jgi:hypothetical protein